MKKKIFAIFLFLFIAVTLISFKLISTSEENENSIYKTIDLFDYKFETKAGIDLWNYLLKKYENSPEIQKKLLSKGKDSTLALHIDLNDDFIPEVVGFAPDFADDIKKENADTLLILTKIDANKLKKPEYNLETGEYTEKMHDSIGILHVKPVIQMDIMNKKSKEGYRDLQFRCRTCTVPYLRAEFKNGMYKIKKPKESAIYKTIEVYDYDSGADGGMELWSYIIEENKNFPKERFNSIFFPMDKNIRAKKIDLDDDGVDEVIGYVANKAYSNESGVILFVLKKKANDNKTRIYEYNGKIHEINGPFYENIGLLYTDNTGIIDVMKKKSKEGYRDLHIHCNSCIPTVYEAKFKEGKYKRTDR